MILCPSIMPESADEAVTLLHGFGKWTDLVEIRIDSIPESDLARLLRSPRPKVIIARRQKKGKGNSCESDSEHFSILRYAAQLGAEYVDLEFRFGKTRFKQIRKVNKHVKIICSYHNFNETPGNLRAIYEKMKKFDADVIKIAAMGNVIQDNETIFEIARKAGRERKKFTGICMGEYGEISRIIGGKFGMYLTYASPADSDPTGPGQKSYEQMKYIFRTDLVKKSTKIFGLIGNPVRFSKGIFYHNNIFSRRNINAVYVNFLVDDLDRFLPRALNYAHGFSVTMPFKRDILKYVDETDDTVKNLGAINTVIRRGGRLIGFNTDLSAVTGIFRRLKVGAQTRVMILGTGSMAKTIACACSLFRAPAVIVGRDLQKARDIAAEYNFDFLTFGSIAERKTDILINATSAGMGDFSERPPIPDTLLRRGITVIDAVSNPEPTRLIAEAEKHGCATVTGSRIFNLQAQLQSRLFLDLCR